MVAALTATLMAVGCSGTQPLLTTSSDDTVSSDTGTSCSPGNDDGVAVIAFEMVRNPTDDPVTIVDVEPADPHDIELVAARVHTDQTAARVGPHDGETWGELVPLTVEPEDWALVEVLLRPTVAGYGWTNGLWITAESPGGNRVRLHTCHHLLVSNQGDCIPEQFPPLDEDHLIEMCGHSEPA